MTSDQAQISPPRETATTLTPQAIQRAADALLAVRRGAPPIIALPAGSEPTSYADIYAIQDAVTRQLTPAEGYKLGKLPDGFMCAPLHRETVRRRPMLSAAVLNEPLVEAELAFRMNRDIPLGTGAAELREAMTFVPLFEILSSRFVKLFATPLFSNLADGFGSAVIGLGDEVPDWTRVDPAAMIVRITANDETLHVLDYAPKLEAAVALIAGFAETFEGRFDVMPAGTLITTGSMTVPFPPQRRIIADYGPLGINEVIFSDL